jgi:hypothetical protein
VAGDAADATTQDLPIAPQAVPVPPAGQGVITVSVWADADPASLPGMTVTSLPLAGATIGLWPAGNTSGPPIATCVSDADGDCSFIVDPASVTGNLTLLPVGAPTGYQIPTKYSNYDPVYSINVTAPLPNRTVIANTGLDRGFGYLRVNPALPESCGLSIALIVDMSGSMWGYEGAMFAALDGFLDTLVGSNSEVSLYDFTDVSPYPGSPNHPLPQDVSTQAGADIVKSWYAAWAPPGGLTSWAAGLAEASAQTPTPDAVVLLADGDLGNNPRISKLLVNAFKAQGARFIPVGMGGFVDESGLASLTGPTKGTDYFLAADFDNLGEELSGATTKGCQTDEPTSPPPTDFSISPPPPTVPIEPTVPPLPPTGPGDLAWPGQIAFWSIIAGLALLTAAWRRKRMSA